jgi:hypothetical protein
MEADFDDLSAWRGFPRNSQSSVRQKPVGGAIGSGSILRIGSRFEMKQ